MRAPDPVVTFIGVLVIGLAAGFLFDRLAGPSWLARQFSGSTRGLVTSALVGIAGALIGYHIGMLLALGGGIMVSAIAAALGATVVLRGTKLPCQPVRQMSDFEGGTSFGRRRLRAKFDP